MKANFKVKYYNTQTTACGFLHVLNEHTTNEVRMIWDYEPHQRYMRQTGVWKIKKITP